MSNLQQRYAATMKADRSPAGRKEGGNDKRTRSKPKKVA
jgi:hypothetical protein